MEEVFDVAIIGGSFSGISAALFLANAMRKVVIIDDKQPRNKDADVAFNLPTYNQKDARVWLQCANEELDQFPKVSRVEDEVVSIAKEQACFTLSLKSHKKLTSKKIIFATGVKDILPNIQGISRFWPQNIFHCPYCIAYKLQNEALAIYSTIEEAYQMALIICKWTDKLTVLTDGHNPLTTDQYQHLQSLGISVVDTPIHYLDGIVGEKIEVDFNSGENQSFRGVFMHLDFELKAKTLIQSLGCKITENKLVEINSEYQTTIEGVYAIGDITTMVQKLTTAIASGTEAAFFLDHTLSFEYG